MALRGVLRGIGGAVEAVAARSGGGMQKRHAGNMPVRTNSFVESWSARRENIESEFR